MIEPPCTDRYARWCGRSAVNHRLLPDLKSKGILFSFKFFSVDQKIDGYVEIFRQSAKHLNIGASFSVFIMRKCLTADIQIQCYLQLIQIFLFSYDCQSKKSVIFIHTVKISCFFMKSLDFIVTNCYNKYVTICNVPKGIVFIAMMNAACYNKSEPTKSYRKERQTG